MFDSASWPFANLLTLSERIGPRAPLAMLHEAGGLAVKMQVSGQRRHQHVSGATFDLVPPAGFEPARAARSPFLCIALTCQNVLPTVLSGRISGATRTVELPGLQPRV
jgi:hypothetical protein